jgi:hypothetical protein
MEEQWREDQRRRDESRPQEKGMEPMARDEKRERIMRPPGHLLADTMSP